MRVVVAGAIALACGLGGLVAPLSAAASPVAARAVAAAEPVTNITLNLGQGGSIYDGVGGVLGGGGNARYLMDYPAAQRQQILEYLFKPDYGASLQILKLEIGGDADTSDGAEPSIEHTRGHVNCRAGYELAVAKQAVRLNPGLRLYALQWAAPGWVSQGRDHRFTTLDIDYLLDWLGCARRQGLTISYLGGWSESDSGRHQSWWKALRTALNQHGYRQVRLVAPDSTGANEWHYVSDSAVAVLGAHDVCGRKPGLAPYTICTSPWSANGDKYRSSQPMWNSEFGAMSAGAMSGCAVPCAPAMDRAVIRGFVDARLTGFLEWPVVDAMPGGLPYGNRGLVTADQPWSGSYQVNALTWATAQLTQFAAPPGPGGAVVWRYVTSAGGRLDGQTADGSYVSLVRTSGGPASAWSTMIEATTASTTQRAMFHITGGSLARATVHVWASNFDPATDSPGQWFVRQPSIQPNQYGRFSLVIKPGWVYSLTTTTGQGKGTAAGPPASSLNLPLTESLGSDVRAGSADDEPAYLGAEQGAFELAPCTVRDGGDRMCTEQEAASTPVFWHTNLPLTNQRFPYAVIGTGGWANYQVSADVLLPGRGSSAGLIGRYGCRATTPNADAFDGYLFNLSATGSWSLTRNANPKPTSSDSACAPGPARPLTLASGHLAKAPNLSRWHHLSLAMAGSTITASVDGVQVAHVTNTAWASGLAGLEAGAFTGAWPHVQYSHLAVTPLGS
jgi:hypothetical protein